MFVSYALPAGLVKLSGSNDPNAKNLKACTGECDNDEQCAYGLKCFQREHGEPIPGCYGKGGGPNWDYCYDPTRKHVLAHFILRVLIRDGFSACAPRPTLFV